MALRTRLAVLFAAAVAVLVALGAGLLVAQLSDSIDAALDSSLSARADALAQQVSPDGSVDNFQDGPGSRSVLTPAQTLAQVVGSSGRLVESSDGAGPSSLLSEAQLTSARTGTVAVTSSLPDGQAVRLLAMPVPNTGNPPVVVVVGTTHEVAAAALSRVLVAVWVGGPAAVAVAAAGAWLVVGAALRPVERMRVQAAAISASDRDARLSTPKTRDEIARLGQTMNELLDRLQGALAQQRAFVADAGHELRTPLTTLRAELELAARPDNDLADLRAAVEAAAGDTDRLIRLAEELLALAKTDDSRDTSRREVVDIAGIVAAAAAADAARRTATSPVIEVELRRATPVLVWADPDSLRSLVDNLLTNANRASPPRGIVTVIEHTECDL
jgi:signal transduction histidine kinase